MPLPSQGTVLWDQVQENTDATLEPGTRGSSVQECARYAETLILADRKRKASTAWSDESKAKARVTRDARKARLDDYPRLLARLDAMTQQCQCLRQHYDELKGCALGGTLETVDQMLSRHEQEMSSGMQMQMQAPAEVEAVWISQAPDTEPEESAD